MFLGEFIISFKGPGLRYALYEIRWHEVITLPCPIFEAFRDMFVMSSRIMAELINDQSPEDNPQKNKRIDFSPSARVSRDFLLNLLKFYQDKIRPCRPDALHVILTSVKAKSSWPGVSTF